MAGLKKPIECLHRAVCARGSRTTAQEAPSPPRSLQVRERSPTIHSRPWRARGRCSARATPSPGRSIRVSIVTAAKITPRNAVGNSRNSETWKSPKIRPTSSAAVHGRKKRRSDCSSTPRKAISSQKPGMIVSIGRSCQRPAFRQRDTARSSRALPAAPGRPVRELERHPCRRPAPPARRRPRRSMPARRGTRQQERLAPVSL